MSARHRWLTSLLGLALGALVSVTCGPPGPVGGDCRFDPNCPGGIGGFCDSNQECGSGHCCKKNECADGMCTVKCDKDPDCPAGMLCESGTCYFSCDSEADCAVGQECKNRGVCYWD
jgi:hypothetical protein